jgi:hypothetical protein
VTRATRKNVPAGVSDVQLKRGRRGVNCLGFSSHAVADGRGHRSREVCVSDQEESRAGVACGGPSVATRVRSFRWQLRPPDGPRQRQSGRWRGHSLSHPPPPGSRPLSRLSLVADYSLFIHSLKDGPMLPWVATREIAIGTPIFLKGGKQYDIPRSVQYQLVMAHGKRRRPLSLSLALSLPLKFSPGGIGKRVKKKGQ